MLDGQQAGQDRRIKGARITQQRLARMPMRQQIGQKIPPLDEFPAEGIGKNEQIERGRFHNLSSRLICAISSMGLKGLVINTAFW